MCDDGSAYTNCRLVRNLGCRGCWTDNVYAQIFAVPNHPGEAEVHVLELPGGKVYFQQAEQMGQEERHVADDLILDWPPENLEPKGNHRFGRGRDFGRDFGRLA